MREHITVKLNGKKIKKYRNFIDELEKKLLFPVSCDGHVDRFFDWMCDLSWLEARKITIIFVHFSHFVSINRIEAEKVLFDFENIIIPFWRDEVKRVVVDGEVKEIELLVYS